MNAHRMVVVALGALGCGPSSDRDPAVAEATATASATASPDPVDTAPTATASQAAGALSPRCELPLVTGKCRANFPVFGYDPEAGQCVAFTYGGCDGNDNRFETLEACKAACR